MRVPGTEASLRRTAPAAAIGGLLVAALFALSVSAQVAVGGSVGDPGEFLAGLASATAISFVWYLAFLLAVLVVVADATPRSVGVGAALVFTVGAVLNVGQRLVGIFDLRRSSSSPQRPRR